MGEFLRTHWFAVATLLIAAVVVLFTLLKKLPRSVGTLSAILLSAFAIGGLTLPAWEFDTAILEFVPIVVLLALRSLSGLGPVRKWFAIGARCAIVTALVLALAEPRFGRITDEVCVIFVIDRSQSIPQEIDFNVEPEKREDQRWKRLRVFIENTVNLKGPKHRNDLAGVILFGKRPKLALPPSPAIGWMLDDRM